MNLIDLQSDLKIQIRLYKSFLSKCPYESLLILSEEVILISEKIEKINQMSLRDALEPIDTCIVIIESNLNQIEQ